MKILFQECDPVDKSHLDGVLDELGIDPDQAPEDATHLLRLDAGGLGLLRLQARRGELRTAPTRVDFLSAALNRRRRQTGKARGIAKAVGLERDNRIEVIDACTGLGRDAFILASLGCRVTQLEVSPLIHALLQDGFVRARRDGDDEIRDILARMRLCREDALTRFASIRRGESRAPDVIYLDPMFPPRSKSAKVKKDMVMLQEVLESESTPEELLAAAQGCAKRRVVLKRPGPGKRRDTLGADFIIPGKSAHFAVFMQSGA